MMDLTSARNILEFERHDVARLWETVAVEQEAVRARAAKAVLVVSLEGLADCDRSTGLQRKALDKRVSTVIKAGPWHWGLR